MIHNARYHATHGKWHKILIPKQMLQTLLIALTQIKAGSNSERTSDNQLLSSY